MDKDRHSRCRDASHIHGRCVSGHNDLPSQTSGLASMRYIPEWIQEPPELTAANTQPVLSANVPRAPLRSICTECGAHIPSDSLNSTLNRNTLPSSCCTSILLPKSCGHSASSARVQATSAVHHCDLIRSTPFEPGSEIWFGLQSHSLLSATSISDR